MKRYITVLILIPALMVSSCALKEDNPEQTQAEGTTKEEYTDQEIDHMEDLNRYPGSTRNGKIEDEEAIQNVVSSLFESLQSNKGTNGDSNSFIFQKYAYDKKFSDLNTRQKEELFDAAYETGMFVPYNEKALVDDEKFNVIAQALVGRTQVHKNDKKNTYTVDYKESAIRIKQGEVLTRAFIPSQEVTLVFDNDRTPDINLGSTKNPYGWIDGIHLVKSKGIWYVSKQTADFQFRNALYNLPPIATEDQRMSLY